MKNKILLFMLTLLFTLSFSFNAFAATSAKFSSNSYCTATISKSLMNSKKYKTASVKITTHQMNGWKSGGVVNVTLTDGKGNYIGTYKKKSGDTIKLGNDHSSYRIYISKYEEPQKKGFFSNIINSSSNFMNSGACWTWKVSKNKNCTIK